MARKASTTDRKKRERKDPAQLCRENVDRAAKSMRAAGRLLFELEKDEHIGDVREIVSSIKGLRAKLGK